VERVTGAPATMRREHVEVERLTAELERIRRDIEAAGIDNQQRRRLRQLLSKAMTPREAEATFDRMTFDRMEHAAAEARRSSQG
jgi:hypothetical protein